MILLLGAIFNRIRGGWQLGEFLFGAYIWYVPYLLAI